MDAQEVLQMSVQTNRKYPTRRFGSRQQKFRTCNKNRRTPKKNYRNCDLCRRDFRDYPGCVLIDSGMRYVLCKTHLRFARNHHEHFLMVMKAFLRGTPIEECEL